MVASIAAGSTSSKAAARLLRSDTGSSVWPSSATAPSACSTPAWSRSGASWAIPTALAILSAVLKPMPQTSRARRYGSSVMTVPLRSPNFL